MAVDGSGSPPLYVNLGERELTDMKKLKQTAGLAIGFGLALPAFAQEIPGTGLSLNLESAQIVDTGRTVNMHRVPVIEVQTGNTTFYDVTATFSLDANGNIIFDQIMSRTVSPPLNAANFTPGVYAGTAGHTYILSGPAQVGESRTAWTLVCQDCRASMSWTTGSPIGHPEIGARPIAQELSNGFSYGIVGENRSRAEFSARYDSGDLIGARQVGEALTIALFDTSSRGGAGAVATSVASVTPFRQAANQ